MYTLVLNTGMNARRFNEVSDKLERVQRIFTGRLFGICSLFADDANISQSYRNTTERNILQSGLFDLYDWT